MIPSPTVDPILLALLDFEGLEVPTFERYGVVNGEDGKRWVGNPKGLRRFQEFKVDVERRLWAMGAFRQFREPITEPVFARLWVFLPTVRADGDNCVKSCLDALSEGKGRRGILKNDRQVRRCDYAILRGSPRLVVALYPFDDAQARADLVEVLS